MRYIWLSLIAFLLFSCTPKKTNYTGEYFRIVKGGKYALFNNDGVQLTKGLYDSSSYPSEGYIATKKDGRWGYLDKAGNEVIPFIYKRASNFKNGLAVVFVDENRAGYIDKNGTMVISARYSFAEHFNNGVAAVELDKKWAFIDRNGSNITPFKYDRVQNSQNSKAIGWFQSGDMVVKCEIDSFGKERCR